MARALQFSGLGTYAPRPTNAQGLLLNGPFRMGLFAFAPGATPEVPQAVPAVRPAVATFQIRPVVKPIPMPRLPWRPVVKGNAGPALSVMQNGGGLGGLSGLGGIYLGCAPFQIAIKRLKATLALADDSGVSSDAPAYKAARNFLNEFDGFLEVTVIYAENACTISTLEAERHISNVGSLVDAIKGAGTSGSTTGGSSGGDFTLGNRPGDADKTEMLLSAAKWIAGAASVIGIVYLAGPLIRAVTSGIARRINK